ncbi:hypothetical protein FJZ36_01260 [Candidatus Poribacteria bacterium]|nr:hypothetical protein [Candidatus Poribacteria bacterium]
MSSVIFYGFAFLAIVTALVVVTSRNVVHSAFALMVTLFCVAAFYVYLDADFLAAIQLIVYVGGILVLVLFGVMMTSGRLDMKLRADAGLIAPAVIVGLLLMGLLLYVARSDSAWKRQILVEDASQQAASHIAEQAKSHTELKAVRTTPVVRRFTASYSFSEAPDASARQMLSRHVEDTIRKTGLTRLYVTSVRSGRGSDRRIEVAVEKRRTTLMDPTRNLSAEELDAMTQALTSVIPGFVPESVQVVIAVEPVHMLLIEGVTDQAVSRLTEDMGLRVVEDEKGVVGLGDSVMMGEYLLPFEVTGLLLLVALIGAAVISRKGVVV